MTAVKKALSPEVSAALALAVEFHVKAAQAALGQARGLFGLQNRAAQGGDDEVSILDPLGLSTQRAVHELEAALHATALTSITVALANLEAQGFEVRGLVAARTDAETRARQRETIGRAGNDPDAGPK